MEKKTLSDLDNYLNELEPELKALQAKSDYYRELCCCAPGDYQLKVVTQSIADHLQYENYLDPNANDKTKQAYLLYLDRRAKMIMGKWIHPGLDMTD